MTRGLLEMTRMAGQPTGLRVLLGSPAFLRLWAIGGCVNTMRWFELLSAATDVPEFARAYQRSVPLADDTMSSCAGALGQAAQDVLTSFVTDLEAYWRR